jgi:amphi-Trp domain-containing protein
MQKPKVSFRQSVESKEAVKLLGDLVKSLEAGKIVVEQGKEFITMDPAGNVDVEVEAKHKKNKAELSIELSWRIADAVEEVDPLKISSKEPKKVEEDKAPEEKEPKEKDQDIAEEKQMKNKDKKKKAKKKEKKKKEKK